LSAIPLILTVFVACAVEAVEALTIVMAAGLTREWKSTFWGVGVALVVLAAVTAAIGPALTVLPLWVLRLVVGGLLAIFGLQWLRKAVSDWYAFTLAFKGVLLEGLEVVFIVLTFGASQHNLGAAVIGAVAAVVLVTLTGIAVRAPLARVPENWMKLAVGVMLTSFGTFWGAEGAGADWPGGDAALLVLVPVVALVSAGCIIWLRSRKAAVSAPAPASEVVGS